jgi:hypothetical protein
MPATVLDPQTALIVIDPQKGIVTIPAAHPIADVIQRSRRLDDTFRPSSRLRGTPTNTASTSHSPSMR